MRRCASRFEHVNSPVTSPRARIVAAHRKACDGRDAEMPPGLKTDAQGKTHGLAVLRMELDVPSDVLGSTSSFAPLAGSSGA